MTLQTLIRCIFIVLTLATSFTHVNAGSLPASVDGEPLPSLAPMLEKVTPAVVNISTKGAAPAESRLMQDPFFRYFYGLPRQQEARRPQSLGSGVIIDSEQGLVVTNHHVIEDAVEILVTLVSGRELSAELIGSDPSSDIAVLKIDATDLIAIDWADSSTLRVGDFCVAIGNPFGLGQTVTSGIVSALQRSGLGIEDFENFIQTDASINPGNSGGALVDLNGRLIGINTAIVGPSGGNVGIGFAIPSNMARDIVEQLIEVGEVRRGALGIVAQPLTPALAEAFRINQQYGVMIQRVKQGSPAEKAGLQVEDVITHVGGRPVRDVDDIKNRIGLVRVGQQLLLRVIRDGSPINIEATIEEIEFLHPAFAGVEFEEAVSARGRPYVVIESIEPGSLIDQYGLQAGDIILAVNQRRVQSMEEIAIAAAVNESQMLLRVQRGRVVENVLIRQ